jgi:hypothetical protein
VTKAAVETAKTRDPDVVPPMVEEETAGAESATAQSLDAVPPVVEKERGTAEGSGLSAKMRERRTKAARDQARPSDPEASAEETPSTEAVVQGGGMHESHRPPLSTLSFTELHSAMHHSAGGGPTRFGDVRVLDSGDPDFSIRIIEVEAGAGEALRLDALHSQAIAFVADVGDGSRRVLLEAELLPLDELPFPLLLQGRPVCFDLDRGRGRREWGGEGIGRRWSFVARRHEDGGGVLIPGGVDRIRLGFAAKGGGQNRPRSVKTCMVCAKLCTRISHLVVSN